MFEEEKSMDQWSFENSRFSGQVIYEGRRSNITGTRVHCVFYSDFCLPDIFFRSPKKWGNVSFVVRSAWIKNICYLLNFDKMHPLSNFNKFYKIENSIEFYSKILKQFFILDWFNCYFNESPFHNVKAFTLYAEWK